MYYPWLTKSARWFTKSANQSDGGQKREHYAMVELATGDSSSAAEASDTAEGTEQATDPAAEGTEPATDDFAVQHEAVNCAEEALADAQKIWESAHAYAAELTAFEQERVEALAKASAATANARSAIVRKHKAEVERVARIAAEKSTAQRVTADEATAEAARVVADATTRVEEARQALHEAEEAAAAAKAARAAEAAARAARVAAARAAAARAAMVHEAATDEHEGTRDESPSTGSPTSAFKKGEFYSSLGSERQRHKQQLCVSTGAAANGSTASPAGRRPPGRTSPAFIRKLEDRLLASTASSKSKTSVTRAAVPATKYRRTAKKKKKPAKRKSKKGAKIPVVVV